MHLLAVYSHARFMRRKDAVSAGFIKAGVEEIDHRVQAGVKQCHQLSTLQANPNLLRSSEDLCCRSGKIWEELGDLKKHILGSLHARSFEGTRIKGQRAAKPSINRETTQLYSTLQLLWRWANDWPDFRTLPEIHCSGTTRGPARYDWCQTLQCSNWTAHLTGTSARNVPWVAIPLGHLDPASGRDVFAGLT